MQMGYSGSAQYNETWMRQVLVLRGEPLLLDANTQNELDASREVYAPAFLESIVNCSVDLWIIPKGAPPFSMRAPYADDLQATPGLLQQPELFPAPLPQLFLTHYKQVDAQSRYFDLWACKHAGGTTQQHVF